MAPTAMATAASISTIRWPMRWRRARSILRDLGYRPGVDWGFEVEVPDGFDYLLADRETLRPVSFFAERGVTRVKGRDFADLDQDGLPLRARPARTGRNS